MYNPFIMWSVAKRRIMQEMKMNRILIVTGGSVDYEWAADFLSDRKYSYIIAVDGGYKHVVSLNIKADAAVGDFDSLDSEIFSSIDKSIVDIYPSEKDFTDTELALHKAMEMDPEEIDIIGGTGSRADHFMTSVMNLKFCADKNIKAAIYDKNNKIYLIENGISVSIKKEKQYGEYVSLVPLSDIIVTLEGFKYPLDKANVLFGTTICQSNEIKENEGCITVHKGIVAVCESKD